MFGQFLTVTGCLFRMRRCKCFWGAYGENLGGMRPMKKDPPDIHGNHQGRLFDLASPFGGNF